MSGIVFWIGWIFVFSSAVIIAAHVRMGLKFVGGGKAPAETVGERKSRIHKGFY